MIVTFSRDSPETDADTRFNMACTCISSNALPRASWTKTDALGSILSRTNTDFSGNAKCTLAPMTSLIEEIERAISTS